MHKKNKETKKTQNFEFLLLKIFLAIEAKKYIFCIQQMKKIYIEKNHIKKLQKIFIYLHKKKTKAFTHIYICIISHCDETLVQMYMVQRKNFYVNRNDKKIKENIFYFFLPFKKKIFQISKRNKNFPLKFEKNCIIKDQRKVMELLQLVYTFLCNLCKSILLPQ